MKTKASTVTSLKFDWVNPDIDKLTMGQVRSADLKVFNFPGEYLKSEEIIARMEKEGYSPANLAELLMYAKDEWNDKDWVVALGSVARVDGDRGVPGLWGHGSERSLNLFWFDGDWSGIYRFLAFRNEDLEPMKSDKALGTLDSGTLREEALKLVSEMEEIIGEFKESWT